MKIRRISIVMMVMAMVAVAVCSCASKEESTIAKVTDLVERLEKAEDLSEMDWNELSAEMAAIQEEAQKCDFTDAERKEFAREAGKVYGLILKKGMKMLPGIMKGATGITKDALKGMDEALEGGIEGLGDLSELEGDFEEIGEELEGIFGE